MFPAANIRNTSEAVSSLVFLMCYSSFWCVCRLPGRLCFAGVNVDADFVGNAACLMQRTDITDALRWRSAAEDVMLQT